MAKDIKRRFTISLDIETKDVKKQIKATVDNLKVMLADLGSASDKMGYFKELVDYISQIDKAMSALREKHGDAFEGMFGGLDSELRKALENVFNVAGESMSAFGGLKQRLEDAIKNNAGVKELRKIAEEINALFTGVGQVAPIDIEKQFTRRGKSAERIKILTDALSNFATVFNGVNDRVKQGFGLGGGGTGSGSGIGGISAQVQKEIGKLESRISHLKDTLEHGLDLKKISDDGEFITLDFEATEKEAERLITLFKELSDKHQDFLDSGKGDTVEAYENLIKRQEVAMQILAIDEKLTRKNKYGEVIQSSPKKLRNLISSEDFEYAIENFDYLFDEEKIRETRGIFEKVIASIKQEIEDIKRSGLSDVVSGSVDSILQVGQHAVSATEYVRGMTLAIKEMFDVLSKASDAEYKVLLGGQDIAIKKGENGSVSRKNTAEAYLANIMQDTDVDMHSHQGLAANIDAADFEQAIWRQYAGIVKMSAIIGPKDIVTLDLAKVKAEDAYVALEKLRELTSKKGKESVSVEDFNKILQGINPEYTDIAQRWDPTRFGDLAAYIFEVKQNAQQAFDPVQRLQNLLVAISGKEIDFSKYEDLLKTLSADNVGAIFNKIAESEGITEGGKILQVGDISTGSIQDVTAEIQRQKDALIESRQAAGLTYEEIRKAAQEYSKIFHKKEGKDFEFFKKYFHPDEMADIQKMFISVGDGVRDLDSVAKELAVNGFGIDPDDIESFHRVEDAAQRAAEKIKSFEALIEEINAESYNLDDVGIGKYLGRLEAAKTELQELADQGLITEEQMRSVLTAFDTSRRDLETRAGHYTGYGQYDGTYYEEWVDAKRENDSLQEQLDDKTRGLIDKFNDLVSETENGIESADSANNYEGQLDTLYDLIEAEYELGRVSEEVMRQIQYDREEIMSGISLVRGRENTYYDLLSLHERSTLTDDADKLAEIVIERERLISAAEEEALFDEDELETQRAITAEIEKRIKEQLHTQEQINDEASEVSEIKAETAAIEEQTQVLDENTQARREAATVSFGQDHTQEMRGEFGDALYSDDSSEVAQYQKLLNTVNDVTGAVDEKTAAFDREATTVRSVVTKEIEELTTLEAYLEALKETMKKLFDGSLITGNVFESWKADISAIKASIEAIITSIGAMPKISDKIDTPEGGQAVDIDYASIISPVTDLLKQIYGVLSKDTGLDVSKEGSVEQKKPIENTADRTNDLEKKLPENIATEDTLGAVRDAINNLADALKQDDESGAESELTSTVKTALSQQLATESTVSAIQSAVSNLESQATNQPKNKPAQDQYALETTLQSVGRIISSIDTKLSTTVNFTNLVHALNNIVVALNNIVTGVTPQGGKDPKNKSGSGSKNKQKNALSTSEQEKQAYDQLSGQTDQASAKISETGDQVITTMQKVGAETARVVKTTIDGITTGTVTMSNAYKTAMEETHQMLAGFDSKGFFGADAGVEAKTLFAEYEQVYSKLKARMSDFDAALKSGADTTAIQSDIDVLQNQLDGLESKLIKVAKSSQSFLDGKSQFGVLTKDQVDKSAESLKALVGASEKLAVAFRGVYDDGHRLVYDVLDNGVIKSYAVEVDAATGIVRRMELSELGLVSAMQQVNKAAKKHEELKPVFESQDVNQQAEIIKNYQKKKDELDAAVQEAWNKAQQNGGAISGDDLDKIYVMSQEVIRLSSTIQSEFRRISNVRDSGGLFESLDGDAKDGVITRMRQYIGRMAQNANHSVDGNSIQYDAATKTMSANLIDLYGNITKVHIRYNELFDGVQQTSLKLGKSIDGVTRKMTALGNSVDVALGDGLIDRSLPQYVAYEQAVADLNKHIANIQSGSIAFDDAAIQEWKRLRSVVVSTGDALLEVAKINQRNKANAGRSKTPEEIASAKMYTEKIKKYESEFRKSTGNLGFDILGVGNLTTEQQEIANLFRSLNEEIERQRENIRNGGAVELSTIQATSTALRDKIKLYKEANNIVDGTQRKKATYGTGIMNSAFGSNNAMQSTIDNDIGLTAAAGDDANKLKKALDAYNDAYENLKRIYDRLKTIDNPTEDDKAEFQKASAACNNLRKEVEDLIRTYLKLHSSANKVRSVEVDDGFVDDEKGRAAALKAYVDSVHGTKAKIGDFKNNYRELLFTIDNGDGTFTDAKVSIDNLGMHMVETAGDTKRATSMIEQTWNGLKAKTRELWTYAAARFGVDEIIQVVRQGVTYVREIDSALTELKKVTSETDSTYDAFLQTMSKTGSAIGATVTNLTTMAAEWARLGYSLEEAGMLAESTAILLNVSEFDDATAASEALISTMQAFQYTADESQHVVDILNEVGNNYAVSSDGIATALKDSASALMEGGNNLEQATALVAAANRVVQDPSSVGSALRTISLRLRGTSVEV